MQTLFTAPVQKYVCTKKIKKIYCLILCICLDEEKKENSLFDFMNSVLSLFDFLVTFC